MTGSQEGPTLGLGRPHRHERENILESSAEVLLLGSEAVKPQDGRAKLLLQNNY